MAKDRTMILWALVIYIFPYVNLSSCAFNMSNTLVVYKMFRALVIWIYSPTLICPQVLLTRPSH